ncbi:MAG: sugar ABC transporter permease, partial [Chloroflexi bacterium]|nr:sugar ABC transporter permease [Chloroflexota bacterium]
TDDPYFWMSITNTVVIMVLAIPLSICTGLLLAEILFNEKLKFRNLFQTANYLPYVTTPVAVAIIFSLLFDQKIGVFNLILVKLGIFEQGLNWLTASNPLQWTMLVIMIVWQWSGYYMLMYLAGMSSIPYDIYEAARVDGASKFVIFSKITLPLLNNVSFFLTITSVIYTLQLLDQPYLLLRGLGQGSLQSVNKPLMTVMVYFYENCLRQGRLGYGSALTYSLFLLIIIFTSIIFTFTNRKRGAE